MKTGDRRGIKPKGKEVYKKFARAVKRKRKEMGLMQRQMAAYLRIGRASLANIEDGRRRTCLHIAVKICKRLNISLDKITGIK